MWLGRGSDVARMWLGHVSGCGAESPAEVKGKRFPAFEAENKSDLFQD